MAARNEKPGRLSVGIVGAGIGGMMAAIAIAEAGADVTILEATAELGEICVPLLFFRNVQGLMWRRSDWRRYPNDAQCRKIASQVWC